MGGYVLKSEKPFSKWKWRDNQGIDRYVTGPVRQEQSALLDIKNGKIGSEKRDAFEEKAQYFVISEVLKEARKEANMTQEQLAVNIGTKKSYISKLEK